jgi:xanthine dehydrogenase YagR molybdenum-binding subunit
MQQKSETGHATFNLFIIMRKDFFNGETIGDPDDRVDGKVKVTGTAKYAAEYDIRGLVYGVLVSGTIAKGKIKNIDTKTAERMPGVLAIVTHLNRPSVPGYEKKNEEPNPMLAGQEFRPFYNNEIFFNGQPVALAIADSFERAQHAASLVKIQYQKEEAHTDIHSDLDKAVSPQKKEMAEYKRGEANAYKTAQVRIEAEYRTPIQIHNSMEPHAAIVIWEGNDKVTMYNKTQFVKQVQQNIMKAFNLEQDNVKVISKFVGGAFGSASRSWSHEMTALIGAKKVNRPLKVVLDRGQMFTMVGYRPTSIQKLGIGATSDGKLTGITHEAIANTSSYEQFLERITDSSKHLYDCANVNTSYKLVPLDMSTPTWTRGPGETSGVFALESAMDELSYALKMDPLELRMKNYAQTDREKNLPWSAKNLDECYRKGAEKFEWNRRNPIPRSMKNGEMLLGMGMSSAIYGAQRNAASAKAILMTDGFLIVQSATEDTGPGTYTIMTQIAADAMKLPLSKVKFELGDSSYPPAPGEFGSQTTASVGPAVHDVCTALRENLRDLVKNRENSPFKNAQDEDLIFENGTIMLAKDRKVKITYTDILKENNLPQIEITKESKGGPERQKYSFFTFGASFVEVNVHPATGTIKVTRVVSAIDNGKIVNRKTARSQVLGSVVWGIGMSLMEGGTLDHRYGRYVNNNLADYHVPVNTDIPQTDVIFIDKEDKIMNNIGAKGLGEIPLVGFAAALANAVYHATGKRIRELPITPDKLI